MQEAWAAGCCGCKDCRDGGGCTPTYRLGFSLGLCWRGWCLCDRMPCDPCGAKPAYAGIGSCCSPFGAGYGPLPPPGAVGGFGSLPPWYQYYPGGGAATGAGTNFPTPAPTGYPYGGGGTQSPVGSPLFGANFNNMQAPASPQVMPCSYYPQSAGYWYRQ